MARYVKHFKTESDFNTVRNNNYIEPWVSVTDGKGLDYNKSEYEKMPEEYLTFDIIGAGNINWCKKGTSRQISYSKNGGEWTSISAGADTLISVVAGDKVRFKGTNSWYYDRDEMYYSYFGGEGTTCQFKLKGNIMSLTYGDNFIGKTALQETSQYYATFKRLFYNCSGVVDTSLFVLPAMTLRQQSCYEEMFKDCVNLVYSPKLLPAMYLKGGDYKSMFEGCINLITTPELPATNVMYGSYDSMFKGCSKVNYIKCLATNLINQSVNGVDNWVQGVSPTGTFVKSANMDTWPTGASGIPTGWTVQDTTE